MQITLDAINKWLTLISNLGVAAGFVLLTVQLHQSSEALRLEALTTRQQGARASSVAMLDEEASAAFGVAMLSPSELSPSQVGQVWALLESYVLDADQMLSAHRSGHATLEDWEVAKQAAVANINHPVARIIWRRLKHSYNPELVSEIDRSLAEAQDLDWPAAYRGIMSDLRALTPAAPEPAPTPP